MRFFCASCKCKHRDDDSDGNDDKLHLFTRVEFNLNKGRSSGPTVRCVLDNYEFMRDKW